MLTANRITTDDGDCATWASGLHCRFRSDRRLVMNPTRFDRMTRSLVARPRSRRGLLAGAATGLLTALGLGRSAGAADDPRCVGVPIISNQTCDITECAGSACVCYVTSRGARTCANRVGCTTKDQCDRNRDCKRKGMGDVCIKIGGCAGCSKRVNQCATRCA
jgi:hypothetical protein